MTEPVIRARGLRKEFGDFVAVDGIDVEVASGESFGFLGPNGAGKSSTMRMIACVSKPTGGELTVLGQDPVQMASQIKARMGVVPQDDTLDRDLTVRDNLVLYGRFYGLSRKQARARAGELLEFANLEAKADARVDQLSGGMRRRLAIARSLVNSPELLLLDEPTTGLDPQARHTLWDKLFRLKREGVTLVVTTHFMDEAEQLCDRLVVMDVGKIVAQGTPRGLIEAHCTREVVELRWTDTEPGDHVAALESLAKRWELLPDRLLLYTDQGDETLQEIHQAGHAPHQAVVRRSSLEDVFLTLTGRQLVD